MSFRPSPADRPPGRPALRLPRWPRYLVPVVAGLIALGVLVTIIAGVWTDWLWYRSVNYGSVHTPAMIVTSTPRAISPATTGTR